MNPPARTAMAPASTRRAPDHTEGYVPICALARLHPGRGVAALVDGVAVAVFRLDDGALHAVDDVDPCSGAGVLSRGIVGDAAGEPTVASPLYKQRFSLRSGRCLDVEGVAVRVHDVRLDGDRVAVRLAGG